MSVPPQTPLRQLAEAGRMRYPAVRASDVALADVLQARDLDVRCPEDLFLAAAALARDDGALHVIDQLLEDIKPALRGVVAAHEIDELAQELRIKLVVGGDAKLAGYAGTGPLRAWLRVALLRAGLDRKRQRKDVHLDETAWLAFAGADADPALAAFSRAVGPALRAAFEAALARLPSRDRLLLRQHLLDGLSAPELATLHGVHRVTAFRWLASIRQQVLADVRSALARELAMGGATLDSLMRQVRASAVPTVERLLVATPEPR
jgi:RNA polymerase sigma-70 factor, ECF subfamily